MKISNKFVITIFILFSFSSAVDNEAERVNEKYQFIQTIYDDSWALIIGINDYQNLDPLNFAVNDANEIKNLLIDKYGFSEENIRYLSDSKATKDNIMFAFNEILLSAGEKDRVVIFYAGHGDTYKLPTGGDMGYLIPVDGYASKEKIFLTSIPMSQIEEISKMSAAKHILYLVDACYGGLALNTRGLVREQTPEYLKKMTNQKGRQVITAGGKDELVMERAEWGHSAFTKNLISGLKDDLADINDDGIISGEELGTYIRSGVSIDTKGQHTPQKGRLGSDPGEFVFISQTLEEEVALTDESLDELKEQMASQQQQMASQQQQMAQLTELLLAQAQQKQIKEEVKLPDSTPKASPKIIKSKKPTNMKTASTLAVMFPGVGHFYSGRKGKGALFISLELAALAGVAITSSDYSKKVDEYNTFENNKAGGNWLPSDEERLFNAKKNALYPFIGSCTAAGIVWIWNILDVKKSSSSKYSSTNPVSIGLNPQGQIEARISF